MFRLRALYSSFSARFEFVVNFSLRSYLTGILSLLTVSCSSIGEKSSGSEVILFSAIKGGVYHISTIWPDGSHLKPFLTPEAGRSYVFASGNSLRSILVVLAHETNSQGEAEDDP